MSSSRLSTATRVWVRTSAVDDAILAEEGGGGRSVRNYSNSVISGRSVAKSIKLRSNGKADWGWVQALLLVSIGGGDDGTHMVQIDDPHDPHHGRTVSIPFRTSVRTPGGGLRGSRKVAKKSTIEFANPFECLDKEGGGGEVESDESAAVDEPPDDLVELNHLHEPSVTNALSKRYSKGAIYTSTGPVLLALNPFEPRVDLYSDIVMAEHWRAGEKNLAVRAAPAGGANVGPAAPHVYSTADRAYRTMMSNLDLALTTDVSIAPPPPVSNNDSAALPREVAVPTSLRSFASVSTIGTTLDGEETPRPPPPALPAVRVNQSVLVSGESGAGKTVTTKHVLSYLATLSRRTALSQRRTSSGGIGGKPKLSKPSPLGGGGIPKPMPLGGGLRAMSTGKRRQMEKRAGSMRRVSGRVQSWQMGAVVEEKVVEANPILEAFGNARTVRNDNSSRFGKFVNLQFKSTGLLVSANIETYLLEKVRLVHQSPGERNYHIFYELLAGATDKERERYFLGMRTAEDFQMTNRSGTYDRRDGCDDQELFDELITSMRTMGIDPDGIENIMTITVACLHLSNLTVLSLSADESQIDPDNPHLEATMKLLGTSREDFNTALCSYIMQVARETHVRSLPKAKAEKGLEALLKSLYGALFEYIVRCINESIAIKGGLQASEAASIGVLDIFGFETFEKNSFEQLCINYANEGLQQQFNRVVFETEQAEYDREGIEWSFIEFPDNQEVLDLIDRKGSGIIPILDDMCRAPGCEDLHFARDLYKKCSKHPRFEANSLHVGKRHFVIHHYPTQVEYDTEGFVEKNKDEVPREASDLLKSSTNDFVRALAEIVNAPNSLNGTSGATNNARMGRLRRGKQMRITVGSQFTAQLKALRTRINATVPHYIRCMKPNGELRPNDFDPAVVVDQLRCLGIVEAVNLSRVGYSQRYGHRQFLLRYRTLALGQVHGNECVGLDTDINVLVKMVTRLIVRADRASGRLSRSNDEGDIGIQIGKTKVFLRQRAFDVLESLRYKKMDLAARQIQRAAKKFMDSQKRAWNAAITLQCWIRRHIARIKRQKAEKLIRARILREIHSAIVIQCFWRVVRAQQLRASLDRESKAVVIQCCIRSHLAHAKTEYLKSKRDERDRSMQSTLEANAFVAQATPDLQETSPVPQYKEHVSVKSTIDSTREKSDLERTPAEVSEAPAVAFESQTLEGMPGLANSQLSSNHEHLGSPTTLEQQRNGPSVQSTTPSTTPQDGNARKQPSLKIRFEFPPLKEGEYDVLLPVTDAGLLIKIGEPQKHTAAFVQYRTFPDGKLGPAQKMKLIRNKGDRLMMINGESTENKPFENVVEMLQRACSGGLCYVRFLDISVAQKTPPKANKTKSKKKHRFGISFRSSS